MGDSRASSIVASPNLHDGSGLGRRAHVLAIATEYRQESVKVRGSPNGVILSLRAFGPGGKQALRIVRVSACAFFCVLGGK